MKRIKKIICAVLMMVLTITSIGAEKLIYASQVNVKEEVNNDCYEIEVLEDYVYRNSCGELEINAPIEIINKVGIDYYNQIIEGINEVNQAVRNNEFVITENCSVYETEDEELVVQGGGVDKSKTYWWGTRRWACKNCANSIARDLSKVSTGAWGVSAISGILGGPVGIGAGIGAAIGAVRAGWLSEDISYYNGKTSRGVIIDCRWILTYKVKCQ